MRILADENFPRPIVLKLRAEGHDILWARTDCPGSKDSALLERAETEERILWTLDKDFWQLTLQRPLRLLRCGVILFRVFPATPENIGPLAHVVIRAGHPWVRHVSIITNEGIEMFPI